MGANLIAVGNRELILTLMPRTTGRFDRTGLRVNRLRYYCEGYTEQYLSGSTVTVAYNPEDVTYVWALENGIYTEFILIESRFEGKDLGAVKEQKNRQRIITKNEMRNNLQAQIDLASHIETIVDTVDGQIDVNIRDIRSTKKREQSRCHQDYDLSET